MLAGCGRNSSSSSSSGGTRIFAVNYPLAYFAERIGGEDFEISCPVTDGDPAFWKPSAEKLADIQNADLILLNGAGYASWAPAAGLPESATVISSRAFTDRYIHRAGDHGHGHGDHGHDDHGHKDHGHGEHGHDDHGHEHGDHAGHEEHAAHQEVDHHQQIGHWHFTTWLNPELAELQAKAVLGAMRQRWPDQSERFEQNFDALAADLQKLDAEFSKVLQGMENEAFLYSHPVYPYFSQRYGLKATRDLHWEPDTEVDEAGWKELDAMLAKVTSRFMIWEGTPHPSVEQGLQERGITCIIVEPGSTMPEEGDYLSIMQENLKNLKSALTP